MESARFENFSTHGSSFTSIQSVAAEIEESTHDYTNSPSADLSFSIKILLSIK